MVRWAPLFSIALLTSSLRAQPVLTSQNFPDPEQHVPGVRYTGPNGGGFQTLPAETGPGYFWDFSWIADSLRDTIHILSIPPAYGYFFSNPVLYPDQVSTYAQPSPAGIFWTTLDSLNFPVVVEETWEFYRVHPFHYVRTGTGAVINGFPVPFLFSPPDTLLEFPAVYGDSFHSLAEFGTNIPGVGFYGGTIERITRVDGWGTLVTPFDTFQDVVRIHTRILQSDTLYLDSAGMGIRFPPRISEQYLWISPAFQVPVLIVEGIPLPGGQFQPLRVFYVDTTSPSLPTGIFKGPSYTRRFREAPSFGFTLDGKILKDLSISSLQSLPSYPVGIVWKSRKGKEERMIWFPFRWSENPFPR